MSLTTELRKAIDKYVETSGKFPEVIKMTELMIDNLKDEWEKNMPISNFDSKEKYTYPIFDGIRIEPLEKDSPSNMAFILK